MLADLNIDTVTLNNTVTASKTISIVISKYGKYYKHDIK